MKDLIELKNYFQRQKDYYSQKAQIIKDMGDKATSEEVEMERFYIGKKSAFGEIIDIINFKLETEGK